MNKLNASYRGSNGFKEMFGTVSEQHKESIKGRSSDLIEQRNNCLFDRYLYYGYTTKNRYESILADLSSEFFLSAVTIADLITKNFSEVSILKKKYKELSEEGLKRALKKKWDHLSW